MKNKAEKTSDRPVYNISVIYRLDETGFSVEVPADSIEGKKDNPVYHFVWLLGLFGGISTVVYATFLDQGPTFFYIPTITGMLHHSFCAALVVALLMFKQINITYKKWYCTIFGFTCYLTLGAFMMNTFIISDAFHIAEPLLPDTKLTAWVMAPMYAIAYTIILVVIELVKNKQKKESNLIYEKM